MSDWNGDSADKTALTPAGIKIRFASEPKRQYWLCADGADDWTEVPSVTEILRVLDKPALSWWGMCVGIAGVLQLRKLGLDIDRLIMEKPATMEWYEYAKLFASGPLKEHGLTTIEVRDTAGTRGQSVHDALSRWAVDGSLPDPQEYPIHEQGYVFGLLAFLRDVPTLKPEAVELMIGSVEHGYAGRFDMVAATEEEHRVVTKTYPKSSSKTMQLPAGRFMLDCKTAVDVFPEHSLQLAAYELACVECGFPPTDGQLVLQLSTDGRYQCRRSRVAGEAFLAVKGCWRAMTDADQGLKVAYR